MNDHGHTAKSGATSPVGGGAQAPYLLAFMVSFATFLALLTLDFLERDRVTRAERSETLNQLEAVRARLDKALSGPLARVQAVAAQVVAHGDITKEEFNRLAPVLLRDHPNVRSLVVARGTKIEMVWPLDPNRAVLGVDYRNVPTQWPHVRRSIESGRPILQGPVPLIQGGTGLIAREPIYVTAEDGSNSFFGLVSMVVSVPGVLRDAGLDQEDLPLKVAIRGHDGLGSVGDVIFGESDIFTFDPVQVDVVLPYGAWRVAAIPRQGWGSGGGMTLFRTLAGLAFLLVVASSFAAALRARRKHALAQERHREALRYQFLMRAAGDAIHVVDENGRLVECSESFLRERGLTADEAIGMHVTEWDAVLSQQEVAEKLPQVLRSGGVIETRHRRKDGTVFDVEVNLRGAEMDGRRLLYCSARDISDRKILVAELTRSNAELEHFAYVASHDLRQPLRMITSYLSLIERRLGGRLNADETTFLKFAVDGAKRMDRMILDILDYSRIGRIDTQLQQVDLNQIAAAAISNLGTAISEAGAEVQVQPGLPILAGYETELERLFQNLIGNAIKFRSPDRSPKVQVEAHDMAREWVVAISDNGIGIPEDQQARLFNIFQRLVSNEAYEGTGIGLASCRKIVEHHKGRIWVESRENQGATFLVALPKSQTLDN